jgi:hypothetical protein
MLPAVEDEARLWPPKLGLGAPVERCRRDQTLGEVQQKTRSATNYYCASESVLKMLGRPGKVGTQRPHFGRAWLANGPGSTLILQIAARITAAHKHTSSEKSWWNNGSVSANLSLACCKRKSGLGS